MVVGILVIELRLPGSRSLKDKRHTIRGPIEKARLQFHVGIAEVGDQDLWGNAEVCVAVPSSSSDYVDRVFTKVLRLFEEHPGMEVANVQRDEWRG